ncbi:MAG TPA: S8 family serine peptidase [Longimicrobium sp.]|nr:S8 family serine peptidase [Longimicrobium sp.]
MRQARRFGSAFVVLPLALAACEDGALTVPPADALAVSSGVAPATVRTGRGDLVTGDAAVFADALKEIGPDGEVLVWLKETSTPRPSAEFLINLPGSAAETIALATEAPGVQRRGNLGPGSVRGASVNAVVRALAQAGAGSVERMDALPVMVVKLPEQVRHAALQVLLRHPNVDYVSAVRARPVELMAAPVGSNPIDTKHTFHKIPQVWDLTRGSGARVGILDSGFARETLTGLFHDDGRFFNTHGIIPLGFVDDGCGSSTANTGGCTPFDDQWNSSGSYAHGTALAGIVGENDNGIGYVGLAPFATTYSMKLAWNTHVHGHCGDNPWNDSSYCIEDDDFIRTVNYGASRGMHVLSMSFTGEGGSDVYRALSTAFYTYGVFLVAATGNTVGASAKEPASYDVVMGVAGVDAAGNNMYSTAARDVSGYAGGATLAAMCYKSSYCDAGSPGRLGSVGGTSAATANVAGIVGLIRAYHPNATPADVWQWLTSTAEGPNLVVNAYAAINKGRPPLSTSISGPAAIDANTSATWTAVPANGASPYSYAWHRDGALVGSGATYTGSGTSSFQLQLTVADALGATATAVLNVTVNPAPCTGICIDP